MNWTDYIKEVRRTSEQNGNHYPGMIGEVGELVALWQRKLVLKRDVTREQVVDELGDVVWYATAITMDGPWDEQMRHDHDEAGGEFGFLRYRTISEDIYIWLAYWTVEHVKTNGSKLALLISLATVTAARIIDEGSDLKALLQEALEKNVAKLRARFPDGYVEGGGIR